MWFTCGGVKVPLEQIGEDLTLGYVPSFANNQVNIDAKPLAQGGFGMVYKGSIVTGEEVVVKVCIICVCVCFFFFFFLFFFLLGAYFGRVFRSESLLRVSA
jgi:hypothetical protein